MTPGERMSGIDSNPPADDDRLIWLEKGEVNGKKVDVTLRYGRRLKADGLPDINRIRATVYAPDGEKFELVTFPGDDGVLLRFRPAITGFYTVIASPEPACFSPGTRDKTEYTGGHLCQTARAIVEVGKKVRYARKPVDEGLEIVPGEAYLEMDKMIELVVFYEGRRLPGIDVTAFSERTGLEHHYTADENGVARIPVDASGRWLYCIRHADRSKKSKDVPVETLFVTTLVMDTITEYR
jgi:uncharacterized GH25 family protein